MLGINFEWDEKKNNSNKAKHGISFDEAASVFEDERAIVISARKATKKECRYY